MGINQSGTRTVPRMDLRAALLEFSQNPNGFIGTRLFPVFPTKLKDSKYSAITRESLTQGGDTKRAMRSKYNRGRLGAKDKSFSCEENGWEVPLDDAERKLYANDFAADLAASQSAMGVVQRGQEARIAAKAFSTSLFTGAALYTSYAAAPWTAASSDALGQIRTVKGKVRANCGMKPNSLAMSYTNFERLKSLTCIQDAIKYTKTMTDQELENAMAALFGVKQLLVGDAIKNGAKEGQAFSSSDIWSDDYVLAAIVAENPLDLTQPSIGRTFLWNAETPENLTAEQYREPEINSDIFRVRQYTDEQLIDVYFGHLIKVTT